VDQRIFHFSSVLELLNHIDYQQFHRLLLKNHQNPIFCPKNILNATVLDWRKLINPQKLKKKNNAAVLAALSPGKVNLMPK